MLLSCRSCVGQGLVDLIEGRGVIHGPSTLVAEAGFEPRDLQRMTLASYRAALLG